MALTSIVYPALRLILVNRLQKVLHSWEKNYLLLKHPPPEPPEDLCNLQITKGYLNLSEIPLNRIPKKEICYLSALAFKLASLWQQPASEIATQLVTLLCQDQDSLNIPSQDLDYRLNTQVYRSIWQNFKIYSLPTGWIHLELSSIGLAEWLQLLVNPLLLAETPTLTKVSSTVADRRNSTKAFEIIHTYSRCAALLQLGYQAKLVQITPNLYAAGVPAYLYAPCPLPWLNAEQELRCDEPSEVELLAQIIEGWDALSLGDLCWEQRWKTAYSLSQKFQGFYRSCRIFGEVATATPELAQTRLGLVLITQILLHHLVSSMVPLAIEL